VTTRDREAASAQVSRALLGPYAIEQRSLDVYDALAGGDGGAA
jgi:hypothetical protein